MTPTNIRARRKSLGWTQQDLAERLGVNVNTVGRWERGEWEAPRYAALVLDQAMTIERLEDRIAKLRRELAETAG